MNALVRKARQLRNDPVLRSWLIGRMLRRWPGEPAFDAHKPPYAAHMLPLAAEIPSAEGLATGDVSTEPTSTMDLILPGETLTIRPDDVRTLFESTFADTETLLGLHRFAWLPLVADPDPAWVGALWQAWLVRFGTPNDDWPWHPYTAAERLINVLTFAERYGLPGDRNQTLKVLAAHGPAIAERLEYFGDHHTSNHMADNGRGLFALGLMLGLPKCAELGAQIMTEEARRIFLPSGVMREQSTSYHVLLTRQYASAWLWARRYGHPAAETFKAVVSKALGVIPAFRLPGGMPAIGDVTPDCPPEHLAGLIDGGSAGWLGLLPEEDRAAFLALREASPIVDADLLAADGWRRMDCGPWHGLWHVSPKGWSIMPGHGHQDLGSFEIHDDQGAVFIDPGRGAYGETGEAALYRSAERHNTLCVDGVDPYPPNKPYYDAAFRVFMGGPKPKVERTKDTIRLSHAGFRRLGGVGAVSRETRFDDGGITFADRVEGRGRHTVTRQFLTSLPVSREGEALILDGRYRLTSDQTIGVETVKRWLAYGVSAPATMMTLEEAHALPWRGAVRLEKIQA